MIQPARNERLLSLAAFENNMRMTAMIGTGSSYPCVGSLGGADDVPQTGRSGSVRAIG
jgi:hypothetical protein